MIILYVSGFFQQSLQCPISLRGFIHMHKVVSFLLLASARCFARNDACLIRRIAERSINLSNLGTLNETTKKKTNDLPPLAGLVGHALSLSKVKLKVASGP